MSRPLLTISEARETVIGAVIPLGKERVAVALALDRVLAENVRAAGDVPPFPCSAMDGYAVLAGPARRTLEVIGESRAGSPATGQPTETTAIRISTGAAVPSGATAVIRQEDVEVHDHRITTAFAVPPGDNIRGAGEDMVKGTTVLTAGTRLRPAELGAAVAAGAGEVTVGRRPRVQVLTTGDELREPGAPLGPGEIHNSNAPMLVSLVGRQGGDAYAPVQLPDDRQATQQALEVALSDADVLIVSGGVSVGPHDHVKPALAALGVEEIFWGVALQPGRPTWFGAHEQKLVFGLPGNPVSAYVTFALFAGPALAALQGARPEALDRGQAVLGSPVPRNRQREQAVRVRLERREGATVALLNGAQGSHMMSSLLGADALALIPPGEGELPAGSPVMLATLPR